jgi:nickel transport protein
MRIAYERRSSGDAREPGTRSRSGRTALCVCAVLWVAGAPARQLDMAQTSVNATVLTLTYADGSPFAHEAYEVFPAGEGTPVQIGRTDERGRAVFLPDRPGQWRLEAFSEDGPRLAVSFEAGPGEAQAQTGPPIDLAAATMIGLGVLFGIFGLHQLFMRRRKKDA